MGLREKYKTGQEVTLDRSFRNTSIVKVVRQSPNKLFTDVESGGNIWSVMTNRLTKITKPDKIE